MQKGSKKYNEVVSKLLGKASESPYTNLVPFVGEHGRVNLATTVSILGKDYLRTRYAGEFYRSGVVVELRLVVSGQSRGVALVNPFSEEGHDILTRLSKQTGVQVWVFRSSGGEVVMWDTEVDQQKHIMKQIRSILARCKTYDIRTVDWGEAMQEYRDTAA